MKQFLVSIVLLVGLAGSATATTLTEIFTSYYAFGDSLTDDGKLTALPAPSLDGRFTTGPTYAEVIADVFIAEGLDTGNLGLGGATAGDTNLAPLGSLSTFGGQITAFDDALTNGTGLPTRIAPVPMVQPAAPTPGTRPLISVLFGANDFFQGFDVIAAADAVADGIREIGAIAGHDFRDFLVIDLPDIGATPAFAGGGSAPATAATDAFNTRLALNIEALRSEGFNIFGFDTGAVFQDILDDIALGGPTYGIFDASTPCTASISAPGPSCLDLGIDPETLFFADGVHPSGAVHQIVGDRAIASLEAELSAIPLPASLPMMLSLLAGFVLIRRRA